MHLKTIFFLLLLSGLAITSCKKDDPTPEPTKEEIIVGTGITGITIGDPAQKAIDKYGVGSPSYGAFNGNYNHFLIFLSAGVTVYCELTTQSTFSATMPIKSIQLDEPYAGKTDKGIGIGSTKAEVIAAYGQPDSSSAFFGDSYNIGITFVYDDNGEKVQSIEVE